MVCPYLTCANNNNSTIQRKDFESCPPQCWSRRKHWEMSGQTPEMEKNHVPPSRRLLQISVQKDIELIGTVSKRYKSCWLLTLTPATFSEGWWLLRPWSSARLRSLNNNCFLFKTMYLDWDVNHYIMTLLGLGEDTEMKLVVDTGLLISGQLQHSSSETTSSSKHGSYQRLPAHQTPPCLPHDRWHTACWPMCFLLCENNADP